MPTARKTRRHIEIRREVGARVETRLKLARLLVERTRMMIARLDRQISLQERS